LPNAPRCRWVHPLRHIDRYGPEAKPAQPRALIGGHLLSAAVGLAMVTLAGPEPWAAAVAVGLAMIFMHGTDTFHPPAEINPLLVVISDRPLEFLLVPVASASRSPRPPLPSRRAPLPPARCSIIKPRRRRSMETQSIDVAQQLIGAPAKDTPNNN
jgi:hypothetical protein